MRDREKPLLPTTYEEPYASIENSIYNSEKKNKNKMDNNDDGIFDRKKKKLIVFLTMLFINILAPLSTEVQVPALQSIEQDLHTSSYWVQATVTIYMLFFGLAQLFFGRLSDLYGRRFTLLLGLIIYSFTNLGCAFASNIMVLNIFRALQAIGSGAGMVIVYAMACDVFKQNARIRVLGLLGGLRPIVIAVSPVFGGTISAYFGWRSIFYIIGILSLFLFAFVFFLLPETRDSRTIQFARLQDYKDIIHLFIKNRVFVGLILISGVVYGGMFIMFNEFSFVVQDHLGYNEFQTGIFCGLIICGLMVGSIISVIFVKCTNPITVVCCGVIQLFICGVLFVLPLIMYCKTSPEFIGMNIYWVLIPLLLYVCADGLMLPHLMSAALEPFKRQAGSASALAGFWRFFSAAVVGLIVNATSKQHLMTLHIGVGAMAFSALFIYACTLYGTKYDDFLQNSKDIEKQFISNCATIGDGVFVIDDNDNDNDNDDDNDDDDNAKSNFKANESTPLIKKNLDLDE